jgi:CRISPR-associated protein Csm4
MSRCYKLSLKFHSPILTPLHADTTFGHLCWALYYKEGEKALLEILNLFKEGSPPFLISDGFPVVYKDGVRLQLFPKPFSADFLVENMSKEIKKISWVTYTSLNLLREGKPISKEEREILFPEPALSIHNIIDRETFRTLEEGGVYSFKEYFIPECAIFINILFEKWVSKIKELFDFLSQTGFGAKKSIGKGHFVVENFQPFSFEEISNPNGFVTLSNFCPAENDPVEGIYKTFVKYGKLGEEFTFSGNPFKKPLLMIKTGSVFKTDGPPKEFYGRMVENISDIKPQVLQYAYAFPVPIVFPFQEQCISKLEE